MPSVVSKKSLDNQQQDKLGVDEPLAPPSPNIHDDGHDSTKQSATASNNNNNSQTSTNATFYSSSTCESTAATLSLGLPPPSCPPFYSKVEVVDVLLKQPSAMKDILDKELVPSSKGTLYNLLKTKREGGVVPDTPWCMYGSGSGVTTSKKKQRRSEPIPDRFRDIGKFTHKLFSNNEIDAIVIILARDYRGDSWKENINDIMINAKKKLAALRGEDTASIPKELGKHVLEKYIEYFEYQLEMRKNEEPFVHSTTGGYADIEKTSPIIGSTLNKETEVNVLQPWLKMIQNKQFRNKWKCDEIIVRALKGKYPNTTSALTVGTFNQVVASFLRRGTTDHFELSNKLAIHSRLLFTSDPLYAGMHRFVWLYWVGDESPKDIPSTYNRKHMMLKLDKRMSDEMVARKGAAPVEERPSKKLKRTDLEAAEETAVTNPPSFWDTREAARLFGFEQGVNVRQCLQERIDMLKKVNASKNGYSMIVPNPTKCTENDKFKLRQKALILAKAYTIALDKQTVGRGSQDHTSTIFSWEDAAIIAVKELNALGVTQTKSFETVQLWNKQFRTNGLFPAVAHGFDNSVAMADFFEIFPLAKDMVLDFAKRNLHCFSRDLLRDEVINNVLPQLERLSHEDGTFGNGFREQKLLAKMKAKPPTADVAGTWIKSLGIQYDKFNSRRGKGSANESMLNNLKKRRVKIDGGMY